jgi:hypothetical protein
MMTEEKLFKITEAYEKKVNKTIDLIHKLLNLKIFSKPPKFSRRFATIVSSINEIFSNLIGKYSYEISSLYTNILTSRPVYAIARWTTIPFNWLWYIFLKRRGKKVLPLYEHGTHFIHALQGGGKSSLAYNTMEHIRVKSGLGSYINVELEKPRFDPINQVYYKLHQLFDEVDFWGLKESTDNLGNVYYESTQLKGFDTSKFRTVVIDELFSLFNQRENKKSSYNNVFIGLMKSIVHQRHADIDRYYFLSQIDKTDTQLMSIFKWVHEVQVDLDCSYPEWISSGELTKHIRGWWVRSTSLGKKDRKGRDRFIIKTYYVKREFDELYFETKNMSHLYKNLKRDHIEVKRGKLYE